MGLSA
jgi:hypothetical protein